MRRIAILPASSIRTLHPARPRARSFATPKCDPTGACGLHHHARFSSAATDPAEPDSAHDTEPRTPTAPPSSSPAKLPFRFETGVSLFAKHPPRPFPPPFLSPPSGSFSDPLSTHDRSRDRRAVVNGELIRGLTNGDDAVFASDHFICANDGVGAWSGRERGHAGLWARLILHFWAAAIRADIAKPRAADQPYRPDSVAYLQQAYEKTLEATAPPNDWLGTTTATGAQLHYGPRSDGLGQQGEGGSSSGGAPEAGQATVVPLLYVTNLGDSQVMVVRPRTRSLVFKSAAQWHWFDCPRQLGTNSPDTPAQNAAVDRVAIEEGDVVLAMSDGVCDNLWDHEIVEKVSASVARWEQGEGRADADARERRRSREAGGDAAVEGEGDGGMAFVAEELVNAAKTIAQDPFAESPFMEHAIEEGLPGEGGKLDDISVVAALCTRT